MTIDKQNKKKASKPYAGRRQGGRSFADRKGDRKAPDRTMHKGERSDVIRLVVDKLDDDFAGVAYLGEKRYVVQGAMPGEEVLAQETQQVGTIHLCRVKRVLQASPYRVKNDCAVASCGGCGLRHMAYDYQLQAKTALVKRKLSNVYQGEVPLCMAAEGSRNKVHLVFGLLPDRNGKEKVTVGFFDAETHAVVDAPVCLAHGRWYQAVANTLRAWATRSGNSVYRPQEGVGDLRFAVVRHLSDGLSVTIVARNEPKQLLGLYEALLGISPRVSLWFNRNDHATNEVFSSDFRWIAGPKQLQGSMLSVTFHLAPDSFFQTNTAMARNAYRKVQQWIGPDRPVLDLFCGIGITGVLFAQNGCNVHAVECSPSSVEDLQRLVQQNGVSQSVTAHLGEVQRILPTLPQQPNEAIFVDPPRAGLGEEVCRALCARQADTLVYMSCRCNRWICSPIPNTSKRSSNSLDATPIPNGVICPIGRDMSLKGRKTRRIQ